MFLANENFPRPGILLLRKAGYNVKSIQEDFPEISDEKVLKMAQELDIIILTIDRNYGKLIFRYATENPPSVIFFREKGAQPAFAASVLIQLLNEQKYSVSGCIYCN